jgi:hypothetical protein
MKKYGWLSGLLLLQSVAFAQDLTQPIGESPQSISESPIGYATVEKAFDALVADPSAVQSEYEGWTSFNQKVDGTHYLVVYSARSPCPSDCCAQRDHQ